MRKALLFACALLAGCESIPGPLERSMLPHQQACINGDTEACATWNQAIQAITDERTRIAERNQAAGMIAAGALMMGAAGLGYAAGAASQPTTTYYYRRTTIYRRY